MSYQLVIAEKPSVARSIAGVIGADKKQDGYMEGNGYMVSVSKNGAMTTCRFCRSNGSTSFPMIRKSSLTPCVL